MAAFVSSYIPTTTATVTRSADVCSITGSAFSSWYRQDEGTMFAEAPLGSGSRANAATFCLSSGDAVSFVDKHMSLRIVGISGSNSTRFAVSDVTAQADFNLSDGNSIRRLAMAYRASDFQAASTGTLSGLDTSGTVPLVDRALLGTAPFLAPGFLCGHIRRVTYWPQRLPNSLLQSITQ